MISVILHLYLLRNTYTIDSMAQKMNNFEEFALKNHIVAAEQDLLVTAPIRANLKPFQDERGWARVLNAHERIEEKVNRIREFIATTEIDPALLKRCQAVIKGYEEVLAWERSTAYKFSLDPSNRASFIEFFRVESALRKVEQALLSREHVYNKAGAKYGAIEGEMESNIDNIDPRALKEGLLANREYEEACREFQFALESITGVGYKEARERYAALTERVEHIEGVYFDMVEWEKSIGVEHENQMGWNFTCRESFLLQFLRDEERLKFQAEIFLTERNLRIATKDERILNEDERSQYKTLRSLLWIFTEKIEEEIAAGRLRRNDLPKDTLAILDKVKQTQFYRENYELVHRAPTIWDKKWVAGSVEAYDKIVDFLFPATYNSMKSIASGAETDSAAMFLGKVALTMGGSVVDAASLVLLKGGGQAAVQTGKVFVKEAVKEGIKQAAKQIPKKIAATVAERGLARLAVGTTVKAGLLAFPYYHSYKEMMTVLDDEKVSSTDKAFAVARFLKEIIIFERLFAKGPVALKEAIRRFKGEFALARVLESRLLALVGKTKHADELANAALELTKMKDAKAATKFLSDLGKRLGIPALENIAAKTVARMLDPRTRAVVAHASTMAFAMVLTTRSVVTETAVNRKKKSDEEIAWQKEYGKLALDDKQQVLLSSSDYLALRILGREEKEADFSKENVKELLEKYGRYVKYCQAQSVQALPVSDYLYVRLYYPETESEQLFAYTKEYVELSEDAKGQVTFSNYVKSMEVARALL